MAKGKEMGILEEAFCTGYYRVFLLIVLRIVPVYGLCMLIDKFFGRHAEFGITIVAVAFVGSVIWKISGSL